MKRSEFLKRLGLGAVAAVAAPALLAKEKELPDGYFISQDDRLYSVGKVKGFWRQDINPTTISTGMIAMPTKQKFTAEFTMQNNYINEDWRKPNN